MARHPGIIWRWTIVTFWPGSLFLGLGTIWAWRHRRLPATRFLAAWILPFWLLLELVPTKLPHYALPLYPGLALICARAVVAYDEEGFLPRSAWWVRVPAVLWSVVTIAVGFALLALTIKSGGSFVAETAAVVVASAAIALVWHLWRTTKLRIEATTPMLSVVAALFVIVPAIALVLPGLPALWLSAEASHIILSHRRDGEAVAAIGYAEPSFVFLNGTGTALLGRFRGRVLPECVQPHALILVAEPSIAGFARAVSAHHLREVTLGVVAGIDYSNGHHLALTLYRVEPS